jgi:hypothetical protein
MDQSRQAKRILAAAGLLIAGWCLVLKLTGWRAEFAENNWQANQIRLQRYLFAEKAPRVVLLGSSVTGRLLTEYFQRTSLSNIANLGLDGSGPFLGSAIVQRRNDLPQIVLVETYLVQKPWTANDTLLLNSVDDFSQWLARWAPVLRAENRPTTLLYSRLKRRKDAFGKPASQSAAAKAVPSTIPAAEREAAGKQFQNALAGLQQRGVKIAFVRYPTGQPLDDLRQPLPPDDPAVRMSQALGVPLLDPAQATAEVDHELTYTDGFHLTSDSARLIAHVLADLATPHLSQAK